MTPEEGFLLLMRWLHALAAVTWIGGSLFYVLFLRPGQRSPSGEGRSPASPGPLLGPGTLVQFRSLVDSCMAVLLVTGTILLFDRLTDASTGTAYVVTVSVKIGLALWIFSIARGRWQRRSPAATQATPLAPPQPGLVARVLAFMSGVNMTVILGIAVLFLSDLLRFFVEKGLTER